MLLRVVEQEGEKERRALLDGARAQAEALLAAAREEAERLLAAELPAPEAPPGDPALARARREFLRRYRECLSRLEQRAAGELAALAPAVHLRLLAAVLAEVLEDLPSGDYVVRCPPALQALFAAADALPPGRRLRFVPAGGDEVVVASEDATVRIPLSLQGLLARYLRVETERIARRILGDGAF
ncbi:MAG: hypothetical protein Kow0092_26010 [Deferrisomatales bacterium]